MAEYTEHRCPFPDCNITDYKSFLDDMRLKIGLYPVRGRPHLIMGYSADVKVFDGEKTVSLNDQIPTRDRGGEFPVSFPIIGDGPFDISVKITNECGSTLHFASSLMKRSKYISTEEATYYTNKGVPCYIKCIVPILNMLPGLPYFIGCPILPGFAITEKP